LKQEAFTTIKKINPVIKQQAIDLLLGGKSAKSVSKELSIGLGTVSRLRSENLPNIKKSIGGRPRILSDSDKRLMLSGECKTGKQLFRYWRGQGKRISYRCVLNNLGEIGFKSRKRVKKSHLTQKQKMARYNWAKTHINWTVDDWKRVIFSDETKINL
jgi:transposase